MGGVLKRIGSRNIGTFLKNIIELNYLDLDSRISTKKEIITKKQLFQKKCIALTFFMA